MGLQQQSNGGLSGINNKKQSVGMSTSAILRMINGGFSKMKERCCHCYNNNYECARRSLRRPQEAPGWYPPVQITTNEWRMDSPAQQEQCCHCYYQTLGGVSGGRMNVPVLQEWVHGQPHSMKKCKPKATIRVVGIRLLLEEVDTGG
jgi:hypothetical protein